MGRFLRRLAPLSGLLFVGLIVVSFILGNNTPDTGDSGTSVIEYYKDHQNALTTTAILLAYAAFVGLIFAASFRGFVRSRSESDTVIAFAFAGYVLFAVGIGTFAATTLALADSPGKLDPSAAQALNVANNDTFFIFLIGMAAFMFGSGLAVALSGALPRWVGWIGVAIGVVAITPVGWFAMFGVLAWTLVVSLWIFVLEGKEASPQSSAVAAPAPAA